MSADDALVRFERIVADALVAPDPPAALERAARDADLPDELLAALAAVDATGLRLSALIVARLRFERLIHGSRRAAQWYDDDPAAFAAAFRRYQEAVPATAFFPAAEARAFETWMDAEAGRAGS